MTTKFNKFALATTALFALGLGATAASAAPVTVTATAKAKVLRQLTLVKSAGDLDFGTIVSSPAGGTIVIDPAGGAGSCTGVLCTGPRTSVGFTVTGSNNSTVKITSTTNKEVTLSNGAQQMKVVLDHLDTMALGNSGNSGTNFRVGGTLTVGAAQADGAYSGNFDVTIDYN